MKITRRDLLLSSLAGLGSSVVAPITALANQPNCTSPAKFKALITLELLGGFDQFWVFPTDTARKSAIQGRRGSIFSYADSPDIVPLGYQTNLALHPKFKPLEPYLNKMRVTLGVGNSLHIGNSFSHEIAQARMAIGGAQNATENFGWKGRLHHAGVNLIGFANTKAQNYHCQSCNYTPPLRINSFETFNTTGAVFSSAQGSSANTAQVAETIKTLSALPLTRPTSQLETEYRISQNHMHEKIQDIQNILDNYKTPLHTQYLPAENLNDEEDSPWSSDLLARRFRNIAQMLLYLKCQGSSEKIIFVVPQGGHDVHANFVTRTDALYGDLAGILAIFTLDLAIMGMFENVVVSIATDFGRKVAANGAANSSGMGTDHGAGFNCLTLGGKIKGGSNIVYGEMPSAAQLATLSVLGRDFDARSIQAEIISKHLGISPAIGFPGIGTEFLPTDFGLL